MAKKRQTHSRETFVDGLTIFDGTFSEIGLAIAATEIADILNHLILDESGSYRITITKLEA